MTDTAIDRRELRTDTIATRMMANKPRPRGPGGPGNGDDQEGRTGLVTKTRPKTKKPSLYKVLLLNDDYEGILQVARDQVDNGAHILDVQVALTERADEAEQMRILVHALPVRAVIDTQVNEQLIVELYSK